MNQYSAVIYKELVQVSNRWKFIAGRTAATFVVAAVFGVTAYLTFYSEYSRVSYRTMADFARYSFLVSVFVLAGFLSLRAMSLSGEVITSEAVNNRLVLLLASPLTSSTIVLSKGASVIYRCMIGVIALMPLYALLEIFGGVDVRMIVVGVTFITANVCLYTAVGLLSGVLSRSSNAATAKALLFALVIAVGPPAAMIALNMAGLLRSQPPVLFSMSSPFYVYGLFAIDRLGAGIVYYHAVFDLVLASLLTFLACLAYRPMALLRLSVASEGKTRWFSRKKPARTRKSSHRSSASRFFGPGVVHKELRSTPAGYNLIPIFWFALVWASVIFTLASSGYLSDIWDSDTQVGMFTAEAVGFLLFLSISASARVVRERVARTLPILALTSLGAARILLGKTLAVIIEQAVPIVFLAAHLVIVSVVRDAPPVFSVLAFIGLAVSIPCASALGTYLSLAARKEGDAGVLTILVWFLGLWTVFIPVGTFLVVVTETIVRLHPDRELYRRVAQDPSPYAFLWAPFGLLLAWMFFRRMSRRGYGYFLAAVSYATVVSCVLVVGLSVLRGRHIDDVAMAVFYVLPASTVLPFEEASRPLLLYACAMAAQCAATFWMALASTRSFEAQIQRMS